MATIRFTSTATDPGFDMPFYQAGLGDFLFSYADFTATSTRFRFFNDATDGTTFTGSGFAYDFVDGEVDGARAGMIRTITTVINGVTALSVTGLAVSANTFSDFLSVGNQISAFNLLIAGNDDIFGGAKTDTLIGSTGNDSMYGGGGNDSLIGGTENDKLYGGTGADNLRGGSNNDTLYGGLGADELRGGGDRDAFVFNTALGATQRDTITDFAAVDDVIKIDNAIFTAFTTLGTMVASRFHVGVAAADAGDRIIYDRAEGVLSYDRDGRGGAAAVVFALVDPGTALGYQDIVII